MDNVRIEPLAKGIGFFILVVGSLAVIAGILVLRRSGGGRIFAIVVASIGLVGGIGNVTHGYAPGLRDARALRLRHLRALRQRGGFPQHTAGVDSLGPAGVAQPGSASDL